MKLFNNIRLLVFLVLLPFQYLSAQTPYQKLAEILANHSKTTKTLSCDFVQEKSSPLLEKATTMKGKLYFQKPNNIRWEYLGEKASAMVFTADKVVLESKGKKRIYDIAKNPMLAKLNALISGSINGNFLSQKEFDITVGQVKEHFEVVLKPKVNATRLFLKQITLMVLASGDVNSIVMTGKNNDITRIDFSNHQKNVSIDAGIFQP